LQLVKSKKAFTAALLMAGSLQMLSCSYAAALANIQDSFPQVSVNLIQLIATLPCYIVIVVSLIIGKVGGSISLEKVLIPGTGFYVLGVFGLLWHDHLWQIYLCAAMIGVSVGIVCPAAAQLVLKHYTGRDQPRMTGRLVSAGSVGGILMNLLTGIFANGVWHHVFFIHLVFLPVFLACLLVMPHHVTPPGAAAGQEQAAPADRHTSPFFILLCLFVFTYLGIFTALNTNNAMFLAEKGLGSAALAGTGGGALMLGCMLSGLLFNFVYWRLSHLCISAAFVLQAAGLLLIITAGIPAQYCVGMFLIGYGQGIVLPYCIAQVPFCTSPSMVAMGASLVSAMFSNLAAVSPLFFTNVGRLMFGPAVEGRLKLALICSVMCILVYTPFLEKRRRSQKTN
jgi:MFS family permease